MAATGCLARAFTGRVTRTMPAPDLTAVVRTVTSVARQIGWNPRYVNVAEGRIVAYRAYTVRPVELDEYGRVKEECRPAGSYNSVPLERCRPATGSETAMDFTLEINVRPSGNGRFKLRIEGGTPAALGGPTKQEIVDTFARALDATLGLSR
jgi:hypothetical protein